MFWADKIAGKIEERFADKIKAGDPLVIRDEKTLSGRVHVGSLRGIVIHGVIAEVLSQKNIANKFLFELNDTDPMDGLPVYVDQKTFEPYMGKPLFAVPAISHSSDSTIAAIGDGDFRIAATERKANFSTKFGEELQTAVEPMGLPIEWYHLRPYYTDGKFNDVIKESLDHAADIRNIYLDVSGGGKPDDWFPLNVICPTCGKVGTTKVTGWDGKEVTYECKEKYVEWAQGCGNSGSISPFDGNATLPWKVEWPAKWKVLGVDIEGAGKDHYAAGGSREVAARISKEVFNYPPPFDIPYEFFNLKGKKMSASKGLGAAAADIAAMLPPHIFKLLMIRKLPNQPIDFDPAGKTIPNLFDEYDRLSDHYFKRCDEPKEEFVRAFELSHADLHSIPKDLWNMRFSSLIFIVQMPHLDIETEAEKLKGSALNADEKKSLKERELYVKKWIESFAPDEYKFEIQKSTPKDFETDDEITKTFGLLKEKLEALESWEGGAIHETIHAVKTETGIAPKKLFQSLYQIFLWRNSGPQVGWFLSTFSKNDVLKRLQI
jgi:lysyl-tRNA synthetase, class I